MARILPNITATWVQAASYLIGVCLFSISFLVFLNASISFAVTDIIGHRHGIGDVVGTLSFADELLGLAACPVWGVLSDRIGVRAVSMLGFIIIALSFVVLPSARAAYPDLLLVRLLFSLGAAACTTMISAILPTMNTIKSESIRTSTVPPPERDEYWDQPSPVHPRLQALDEAGNRSSLASFSSELTITPARYGSFSDQHAQAEDHDCQGPTQDTARESSKLAGFVGMSTGLGALFAVAIFLPLPAFFGSGQTKVAAVSHSFYTVAACAFVVGALVWFGLADLPGEDGKSLRSFFRSPASLLPAFKKPTQSLRDAPFLHRSSTAIQSVVHDPDLSLACVGGFVARSASAGISLFVPLFVNAYFIRQGLCTEAPGELLKDQCKRAYTLSSMLTGVSQLIALLTAPVFGYLGSYLAGRATLTNVPLGISALAGVVGCILFGLLDSPDPFSDGVEGETTSLLPAALSIPAVTLMGISQIGAIVCSLSLLSQGVQRAELHQSRVVDHDAADYDETGTPHSPADHTGRPQIKHKQQLKGTIAGIYSLCGGAGIILLSKVGGVLFDKVSTGGPFFMLAGFNALLLIAVGGATVANQRRVRLMDEE